DVIVPVQRVESITDRLIFGGGWARADHTLDIVRGARELEGEDGVARVSPVERSGCRDGIEGPHECEAEDEEAGRDTHEGGAAHEGHARGYQTFRAARAKRRHAPSAGRASDGLP